VTFEGGIPAVGTIIDFQIESGGGKMKN